MSTFSPTKAAISGFKLAFSQPLLLLVVTVLYFLKDVLPLLVFPEATANFIATMQGMERFKDIHGQAEAMAAMNEMRDTFRNASSFILPNLAWDFALTAVIAATVFRAVLKPGTAPGFVRLGKDELNQFLLTLYFFAVFIALAIASSIGIGLAIAGAAAVGAPWQGWLVALAFAVLIIAWIWFFVRASLAAPTTLDDGGVRLFKSMGATKGHFWGLLGMWLLLLILLIAVGLLLQFAAAAILGATGMMPGGATSMQGADVIKAYTGGNMLSTSGIVFMVVTSLVGAFCAIVALSPGATALGMLRGRGPHD